MENKEQALIREGICRICQSSTIVFLGIKKGKYFAKDYHLFRCYECGFTFVANPSMDFENIYNISYYSGEGADPLVNYCFEQNYPYETIRQYEWAGIVKLVALLMESFNKPINNNTIWLDYGCGAGSLVKYIQKTVGCQCFGFEEGTGAKLAKQNGIGVITNRDLSSYYGTFDVVSAIEVMEHVVDPIAVLNQIRSLLKIGGIFFYTTGNAERFKKAILNWRYLIPEIHVSYYEPRTMEYALKKSGFKISYIENKSFFKEIIIFKIMKNLGFKTLSPWHQILPWKLITRIVDAKYGVSSFPIGRAALK
jgi:SAM-dependent methyltransferase